MKKRIVSITAFISLLFFVACKQDMELFNQPDGVYFGMKADSLFYSFAKYPSRAVDTLKIPVMVLGDAAGEDRQLTVEKIISPEMNAIEGVHYKMLPPYKMPAGKVSTEIPVVVYRTGDLDSVLVNFGLQLKTNDQFASGISSKTSLKFKLAYLQKPPTWGEPGGSNWAGFRDNFGTWTKTKYKVILAALHDPVSDTTVSEFPYLTFGAPAISIQHRQKVKNYILVNYPGNYTGVGPTLRDPDANNAVILVGPANY